MADGGVPLVARYIETTGNNRVNSLLFTGFAHSVKSPISITFPKAQEVICDTLACLLNIEHPHRSFGGLHTLGLFEKRWDSVEPVIFDWFPADFLYLVTCFLGDFDAVSNSLKMIDDIPRNLEDTKRMEFVGLYIAIRRDHRRLIRFLLRRVEFLDQDWIYVLCAAVETGNVPILQLLLGSEYPGKRDEKFLNYAINRAAEYTNTIVRIQMCELLIDSRSQSDFSDFCDTRTYMLASACRSNDVDFANWIIKNGPVHLYTDRYRGVRPPWHPLLLAITHSSTDIVRFLLSSKLQVDGVTYQWVNKTAFYHAQDLGRFDIFMELIPYQTHLRKEDILRSAAAVDHALEAVDKLLDLAEITPSRFPNPGETFDCSNAMELAVQFQHICNVKWLLEHGCRTKTVLVYQLDCSQYGEYGGHVPRRKSFRNILQDLGQIEHLLRGHNNPGVQLECSYRCRSPMKLEEVLRLPRPWEYECECSQMTRNSSASAH